MIIKRPEEEEKIEEEPKKKKKHFGWLVILIIALVFIATPVALAYGFLYDNSPSEFTPEENFNKEKVIDKLYADPFDNTKDTGVIHYDVELRDVNNIIYDTAFNSSDFNFSMLAEGAYILSDEDSYSLTLKTAGNPIFETKATLNLSLDRTQLEDEDYLYSFRINKMKIGRAELLDNMIADYASRFINDKNIEDAFKKVGFTVDSDVRNRTLSAKESTLVMNVKDLLKDKSDLFYLRMIETFLNLKLIELTHDNDSLLNMDIDLSRLGVSQYHDQSKIKNINIEDLTSKMKVLLNNGLININDTELLLKYLVKGYDELLNSEKTEVSALDLSLIDIPDVTAYQGVYTKSDVDMGSYIHNQIDLPTIALTGKVADIDEDIFTSVMRDKQIIGHAFEFKRADDYHYNVMMIDDIYVNILNDKLIINISLNVNGYVTELIVETTKEETDQKYVIALNVDSVKYGNKDIVSGFKEEIMKLLTFSGGPRDIVTINKEGKILIDFSSLIDNETKTTIEAKGGLVFNLVGTALDELGKIEIKTKN